MRVAIVGSAGFIGQHVTRHLTTAGMEIIAIDRVPSDPKEDTNLSITADMTLSDDITRAAQDSGHVDAVVWLAAAIRHISTVDERSLEDISLMVNAPLQFLHSLRHAPSTLVYLSSIQVYGKPQYLPIDEKHPTNPFRTYGVAKLFAEHMLAIYSKKHGIAASFHRLAFVYGPGQHPDNILPRFIRDAKEGRSPILHGDGGDKRDDIYIDDVVRAVELAITHNAIGAYNIASGTCHTILDVARTVCEVSDTNLTPTFTPTPSTWIDRCFTNDKAKKEFGFFPKIDFTQGVKQSWKSL